MPFAPELCVVLLIRVVRNLWGRAAPVELQGQSQPSGISRAPPRAASPHRPVKSKCCRWQANAILQLVLCHGHVAIVTDAHRCDLPGAVGTPGRAAGREAEPQLALSELTFQASTAQFALCAPTLPVQPCVSVPVLR